jgi:natural product precursor
MNNETKIVINFERLSTREKPESLKVTDMSKLKGGHVARGNKGGAAGADACACGCPDAEEQ